MCGYVMHVLIHIVIQRNSLRTHMIRKNNDVDRIQSEYLQKLLKRIMHKLLRNKSTV